MDETATQTYWPTSHGEMAERIRRHRWEATPLGPVEAWPQSLKSVIDTLLGGGFPAIALWGPDLIQIYNDGYRGIMASKHPHGLGQPTRTCWPEAWHITEPIYERVLAGETLTFDDKLCRIARHGPVEDAWFTLSYSPLRDENSAIVGVLVTVFEVTARHQAEARIAESEQRLRALVNATSYAVYRMSPDWSEMRELDGRGFICDMPSPSRTWLAEYIHPDDQAHVTDAIGQAIRTKSMFELEHRVRRVDGSLGWTLSRAVPLLDEAGAVTEWFGTASDVTEHRGAQDALRESEERFRQFGEASPDVLWIRDAETMQWEYLSEAFEGVYGQDREAALTGNDLRRWAEMILPEDREVALASLRQVRKGERVKFEYRVRRPSDGKVLWMRDTDFPLLDAAGRVQRIGGIGHDATEEKEMSERLQVLVAELQHRTRNLIAVVQSLSHKTLRESATLGEFEARYSDRLQALSRIQGLLSRLAEGQKITFDGLLRAELSALGGFDQDGDRVTLHGPADVRLRSSTVQTFALALHELATNAVKYGALSSPTGRLKVRWRIETNGAARQLEVDWRETGVAVPADIAGRKGSGYGRELIERALPYQLQAVTTYKIGADGVHCTIAVPITEPVHPNEER